MGRTIAVGDIHGCSAALAALLRAVDLGPKDVLVTLGDYIDRGPDSRGVIDQLLELSKRRRLISLLGNHELMLLSSLDKIWELNFWLECGGDATLASYGGKIDKIPREHLEFLEDCRNFWETSEHIFLHANYEPDMPLGEQPEYIMFWEHIAHRIPPPHYSGKTAVVGHTPQHTGEILDQGHLICIDTFCVGGGWLTALDVETGDIWQADRDGNLRK